MADHEEIARALARMLAERPELLAAIGAATGPRESPRVWQLWRTWRRQLPNLISRRTQKPLEPSTVELYERHTKQILLTRIVLGDGTRVRLGSLRWDELSPRTCDQFRSARTARGDRGNYINRILTSLNACLSWHIDQGAKLGRNPLHGARMADERQFRRRTRLTFEDWTRFLSYGPPILQDIGLVAFRAFGMRPAEAALLRKREIDESRRAIVLSERPGCKTGPRAIPVPDDAWAVIVRRMAESRGEYVFVDPRDPKASRPVSLWTIRHWMRRCREESGMTGARGERITPYVARHSGINDALTRQVQIGHVAEVAGAEVKTIEENYLTMSEEDHEAMRRALNSTAAAASSLERRGPARTSPPPLARSRHGRA